MVYRDQIEQAAHKRNAAGMEALTLLGEAVANESITPEELARWVGKIGAAIGGLTGMIDAIVLQHYPERPVNLTPEPVADATLYPLEVLARAVCQVYRISIADLIGPSRKQNVVRPRHVFFYIARLQGSATLKDVGHYCGGRDHSSVIHGASQVENALSIENDLPQIIQTIRASLPPRFPQADNNEDELPEE